MPASGKTTNYELPLYRPLDTVSEMVTFNGAMSKIDQLIKSNETSGGETSVLLQGLQEDMTALEQKYGELAQRVDGGYILTTFLDMNPQAGVTNRGLLFNSSNIVAWFYVSMLGNLSNMTQTKIFDNATLFQIYSFPQTLPNWIVSNQAVSPETSNNIGNCWVLMQNSSTEKTIAGTLRAYRENNVTIIGLQISDVNLDGWNVAILDETFMYAHRSAQP